MPSNPIWGVCFPIQEAQIKEWCWGSCGKGVCGAVDLGPEVNISAVPCNERDCPHVDREMDEPMGEIYDRPLFLRKLKDVPDGE